jgi:hypothetical protein
VTKLSRHSDSIAKFECLSYCSDCRLSIGIGNEIIIDPMVGAKQL